MPVGIHRLAVFIGCLSEVGEVRVRLLTSTEHHSELVRPRRRHVRRNVRRLLHVEHGFEGTARRWGRRRRRCRRGGGLVHAFTCSLPYTVMAYIVLYSYVHAFTRSLPYTVMAYIVLYRYVHAFTCSLPYTFMAYIVLYSYVHAFTCSLPYILV